MYYEIVPMDRGHVDQIAELERQCFSTPWSETQLEDALYNDAACTDLYDPFVDTESDLTLYVKWSK